METAKSYKLVTNLTFYFLVSLNIIVLVFVITRSSPERENNFNSDNAVKSLISSRNFEYLTEGFSLNIGPQNDSLYFLSINYGNLIILRISEYQCDICVLEAITDFRKFLNDNISFNGIIITSISKSDEFEAFKLKNNSMPVFNVNHLYFKVEEINNPYFFLIDHQLKVKMVMVHQKEFPEKTANYFEALKIYLNSQ